MTDKLSAERIRELFEYDPETGVLRWRIVRSNRIRKGDVAGSARKDGYLVVYADGAYYLAHRVAWAHFYSKWPGNRLDHRDLDTGNNRIVNLRECNDSLNMANRPATRGNRSGIKGVTAHPDGRWRAQIMRDGKQHYLGLFVSKDEAARAYQTASVKLFGEFARTA